MGAPPRSRFASPAMLRERREESELLAGARSVLVLRGQARFGRTALLEGTIESASDLMVLRVAGVESEVELDFAALHQMCAPVLDGLDRIPGPQRDALAITFGLNAGRVPDRFLVSLATLNLLSEAARERPLLCVIDDAQWLDRASAQVLAFVARRLQTESFVMLFTTRTATAELAGLPELAGTGCAERALLATGERFRRRSGVARDELTTQEAEIAQLARDGLSNAAIGGRLFLSRHTVAYHLRKVFSKLEITSRNQLGQVLPDSSNPTR